MKGRTPASVLIAMLVTAALAAPAAAAQGTEGLPADMFESAPAEPSGQEGSSPERVGVIVVLSLLAVATATGFAFGELLPATDRPQRRRARVAGPLPSLRPERGKVLIDRSRTRAIFRVVAVRGAGRSLIGRSPSFDAPRDGPVPDDGAARAAYDAIMARLQADGWRVIGQERSVWYHTELERSPPDVRHEPSAE